MHVPALTVHDSSVPVILVFASFNPLSVTILVPGRLTLLHYVSIKS